jgi:hypothetical protein
MLPRLETHHSPHLILSVSAVRGLHLLCVSVTAVSWRRVKLLATNLHELALTSTPFYVFLISLGPKSSNGWPR